MASLALINVAFTLPGFSFPVSFQKTVVDSAFFVSTGITKPVSRFCLLFGKHFIKKIVFQAGSLTLCTIQCHLGTCTAFQYSKTNQHCVFGNIDNTQTPTGSDADVYATPA
jgi:hypothetical protein